MDIGKQVRVLVKEELDKQLGEMRDQISRARVPGFWSPCSKAGNTPYLLVTFKR